MTFTILLEKIFESVAKKKLYVSGLKDGGSGWTRTTDLTLIRGAL